MSASGRRVLITSKGSGSKNYQTKLFENLSKKAVSDIIEDIFFSRKNLSMYFLEEFLFFNFIEDNLTKIILFHFIFEFSGRTLSLNFLEESCL